MHMGTEFKLINANIRIFETLYSRGDVIGKGSFSEVLMVTEKHGERRDLACKILDLSSLGKKQLEGQSTINQVELELNVIMNLNHPNLLSLHDVFFDLKKMKCYMITPLCSGGTLEDAINERGSFCEDDSKTIMKCILKGLVHMHDNGIAHRDIKPDNILIIDNVDMTNVKISDFGMAKKLNPNSEHTICGTPMYIAPEVITYIQSIQKSDEYKYSEYDTKVDIWSCGVVMYRLLIGSPPFTCKTFGKLISKIKKGEYNFSDPGWELVSDDAKYLITMLMEVDPLKRISAEIALTHKWFADT